MIFHLSHDLIAESHDSVKEMATLLELFDCIVKHINKRVRSYTCP